MACLPGGIVVVGVRPGTALGGAIGIAETAFGL